MSGAESMRGGLTPDELRDVARALGREWRLRAQCGTRSKYVAGCRCEDCTAAHRVYERERRLHRGAQPKREQTPRAKVATRVTATPRTAVEIAERSGLPLRDVRILLAQEVAAERVDVAGRHPLGLQYVRRARGEAAA